VPQPIHPLGGYDTPMSTGNERIRGTSIPLGLFQGVGIIVLNSPYRELVPSDGPKIPFDISPARSGIHTVTNPSKPITLVANLSAQFMNAALYYTDDEQSRKLLAHNELAQTASVLAFTLPEDTLVIPLHDEGQKLATQVVKESWQRLGIETSNNIEYVAPEAIDYSGSATPFIISPESLLQKGANLKDAFTSVAAYTKDGPVLSWVADGVPTPTTFFLSGGEALDGGLARVVDELKDWDEVVMNSTNGSGGFGIYFLEREQLLQQSTLELFHDLHNLTLQIQPKLDLTHSPCIIATISADGAFTVQHMSEQRFATPGAHGGNIWYEGIEKDVVPPGSESVVLAAIQSMADRGVRGQINLDFLTLDQEYAQQHNVAPFLVREVNVRPAGSSSQIRMRDILINEMPVKRIHTKTGITIPKSQLENGEVFQIIDQLQHVYKNEKILIYSAKVTEKDEYATIHVGFLSNENNEEAVNELESTFLSILNGPTDTMN